MTVIQLPDEQAAALKAKAAAQGLTLEGWLGMLAAAEASPAGARHRARHYNLDELLAQCDLSAAPSAEDRAWLDTPPVGREAL
jgi:antitoxin ChpS